MTKPTKYENEMLDLINKLQAQFLALDKKLDTLISRSVPQAKPDPKPPVHNPQRTMHTAICADCKKECSIPFKPSGDRPVYCKDCFSRRKVISMSGMKVENTQVPLQAPVPEKNKKTSPVKKVVTKKKPSPKKKR